jgi:LPS-assembly protein
VNSAIITLALASALHATAASSAPPSSPHPAAPAAPPPPPIEVLEAGAIDYDVVNERGVATGGVVLRRGFVIVRADTASYDSRTGEVEAQGSVLLTEPGRAVAANAMHAVLDGPYQAHDVVAFLKEGPLDLSRCKTLDEARRTGHNRFTVIGTELTGTAHEVGFEVDRARVTLCDCGAGPPSWQIRARRASVVPGDHAWLFLPVFYITPRFLFFHRYLLGKAGDPKPIPVFAFPVMYLPLSDRQSGLLITDVTIGGNNGTVITQPLFLTFGRSYDATVSLDYAMGPSAGTVNGNNRGVRGLGGALELRWAPAEGVAGRARLFLQHSDIDRWPDGAARPPGMNRIAFSALHDQRFSDSTHLKLELGVVQDPYYTADFNSDALLRAAEYRRNAIALTHRRDDALLEADVAYYQALTYLDAGCSAATPGARCARAPFGLFGADVSTFHRLPSASATLLPLRLSGPVRLAATVGLTRFAPIRGVTGDEGANGIGPGERGWSIAAIDAGERDGRWTPPSLGARPDDPAALPNPGERLAATRLLARAELRAPFILGRALQVEPWMSGTAAAYAFEAALSPQIDARAVGGLTLSSEFSRTFGQGAGRIRHDVEPKVAYVGGTAQAGPGLPNYAYDEFDVAAPLPVLPGKIVPVRRTLSALPESFHQLQLSLRNRLTIPYGSTSLTTVELTLGQDLDLGAGSPSESWVQGRASRPVPFGTISADVTGRFLAFGAKRTEGTGFAVTKLPSSSLDAFTSLQANVSASDRRGDSVTAGLIAVGEGGSPRMLAGLEPFFDSRPVASDAQASGTFGATGKLSGAIIGYGAFFYARQLPAAPCAGKSTAPHFYQHSVSFTWDSPCKCWKAGIAVMMNECLPAQFSFLLDLSSLSERRLAGGQ